MKKNTNPDHLAYHNGACSSLKVECEVTDIKEGNKKFWYGTACVGDEYFETDQYRFKDYAISEMIGYLEGLELQINIELERLRLMLK